MVPNSASLWFTQLRDKGFVLLHRTFFDHPLWNEHRKFSRAEAWLEIVGCRARGVANGTLKRGEFQAGHLELATAWGWTKESVRRFLKAFQKECQLHLVHPGNRNTGMPAVYAVVNYNHYNGEKQKFAKEPEKTLFDTGADTAPDTGADTAPAARAGGSGSSATQPPTQGPTQPPTHIKEEITRENFRERITIGDRGLKTPAPAKLPITDAMRAWAADKGITANLDEEADAMLDHFRGKGEARKDWVATWRTWMRRTKRFGGQYGRGETPEQREERQKETIRRWVTRDVPIRHEQDVQTPKRVLPD